MSQELHNFEVQQDKFRTELNRASRHYIIDFAMKAFMEILLLNAKVTQLQREVEMLKPQTSEATNV